MVESQDIKIWPETCCSSSLLPDPSDLTDLQDLDLCWDDKEILGENDRNNGPSLGGALLLLLLLFRQLEINVESFLLLFSSSSASFIHLSLEGGQRTDVYGLFPLLFSPPCSFVYTCPPLSTSSLLLLSPPPVFLLHWSVLQLDTDMNCSFLLLLPPLPPTSPLSLFSFLQLSFLFSSLSSIHQLKTNQEYFFFLFLFPFPFFTAAFDAFCESQTDNSDNVDVDTS